MNEEEEEDMRIAASMVDRMKGLIGAEPTVDSSDDVLMLSPCNNIHTFYMKHPIDVAFVSKEGRVLKTYKRLAPRHLLGCSDACITLERFSPDDETTLEGEVPPGLDSEGHDSWFHVGDVIDLSVSVKAISHDDVWDGGSDGEECLR